MRTSEREGFVAGNSHKEPFFISIFDSTSKGGTPLHFTSWSPFLCPGFCSEIDGEKMCTNCHTVDFPVMQRNHHGSWFANFHVPGSASNWAKYRFSDSLRAHTCDASRRRAFTYCGDEAPSAPHRTLAIHMPYLYFVLSLSQSLALSFSHSYATTTLLLGQSAPLARDPFSSFLSARDMNKCILNCRFTWR